MRNATVNAIVISVFSMVPYLLVCWGYTAFTDGDAKTFGLAWLVLLCGRLFFLVIETLGDVLAWRLYGKRVAVAWALAYLRAKKFPMRIYQHDDISNYLARVNSPDYSEALRGEAKALECVLAFSERLGVLRSMRIFSEWEAALEIYSPRAQAKI